MINLLEEVLPIKTDGLFLIVLGASGVGKSHFIGTYPGRTLFLYGSGESHGPGSAVKNSKELLPVAWDRDRNRQLTPNESWTRLLNLLDPATIKAANVKCVALDSITNLCLDLKATDAYKQRCMGAKGQHNQFKETEALIELLNLVMKKLQVLVDYHDIDVITTMDLQIQSIADTGLILESKPGLPTYGVGKAIIQQFPDILVLGRIAQAPKFQNAAKATGISKDAEEQIVKYVEYHPRLRGVAKMPEYIEANVPAILALKKEV